MIGNLRTTILGLILIALALPHTAHADLSARYDTKFPGSDDVLETMTIEINERGDLRYQVSDDALYGLVVDDVSYLVKRTPDGLYVVRAEDMIAAITAAKTDLIEKLSEGLANAPTESLLNFVENGPVVVGGRSGIGYAQKQGDGSLGPVNAFAISDDPKLAPLGAAFAQQFLTSLSWSDRTGLNAIPKQFSAFTAIIEKGAVLSFGGMELSEVSFDPIDPERFALPAEPITLEQAITLEAPFATPPTLTDPKAKDD